MTPQEIIDLGQMHGFEDISDADMLKFLNLAYFDIGRRYPWNFLNLKINTTLIVGASASQLTAAGVRVQAVKAAMHMDTGQVLQPIREDQTIKELSFSLQTGAANGRPWAYYLGFSAGSKEPNVFPNPDTAYTIKWFVTRRLTALTLSDPETAILIPPEHHDVLLNAMLWRLYALNDDSDNVGMYQGFSENGIAQMVDSDMTTNSDRPDTIVDVFAGTFETEVE